MRAPSLACSLLFASAAASLIALTGCPAPPKQVGDTPPNSDEPPTKWEGASKPEPATPTGGGGGGGASNARPVNEAPARRADQYDKEATEVVLKRAARQVKENCGAARGDDGKASGPWGKTTVQIKLGANGRSKGITVPAPYQGKPTGNCVEKAFANLTYPPWGGTDEEIGWEIELAKPDDAAK